MKIILLKDVRKVGKKYETKEVADGFALNALIPQKLAIVATPENVRRVDTEKKKHEAEAKVHEDLLLKNIAQIEGKTVHVKGKVNEKGHLFAGLHQAELVAALKKDAHVEILPEHILLEKAIKEVGEHKIDVAVSGKKTSFKLIVEAE
jgi:large subunit ribosomal protein L9